MVCEMPCAPIVGPALGVRSYPAAPSVATADGASKGVFAFQ